MARAIPIEPEPLARRRALLTPPARLRRMEGRGRRWGQRHEKIAGAEPPQRLIRAYQPRSSGIE